MSHSKKAGALQNIIQPSRNYAFWIALSMVKDALPENPERALELLNIALSFTDEERLASLTEQNRSAPQWSEKELVRRIEDVSGKMSPTDADKWLNLIRELPESPGGTSLIRTEKADMQSLLLALAVFAAAKNHSEKGEDIELTILKNMTDEVVLENIVDEVKPYKGELVEIVHTKVKDFFPDVSAYRQRLNTGVFLVALGVFPEFGWAPTAFKRGAYNRYLSDLVKGHLKYRGISN